MGCGTGLSTVPLGRRASLGEGLRRRLMLVVAVWLVGLAAASAQDLEPLGDEAFQLLQTLFEYDAVPLDARADEVRQTTHGRLYKVVFSGDGQHRVPAYLELPLLTEAPHPCILLIHGMTRSKDYWWTFGNTTDGKHKDRLVAEGFAVLALDLPLHGERLSENDYQDPWSLVTDARQRRLRELFVQAVIEHRRALDYLATRPDIDSRRVGVLGYEFGANLAFALTAMESRVGTAVACVPPTERDKLSLWATQNYAPRLGDRPFLLLMASKSQTGTPADGEHLRALMAAPAQALKVYHSDERLPIWYVNDAVHWFVEHLTP